MRDFKALRAYLAQRETMPFEWGGNDCVTFAAGAVLAMTGREILTGIKPWKDERRALLTLAGLGGMVAAFSAGLPVIAPAHAHRGDIGVVEDERGPFMMVIEGMMLAGPGPNGILRLPRRRLIAAWSIDLCA